jgi:hypothetical protein
MTISRPAARVGLELLVPLMAPPVLVRATESVKERESLY